MKSQEDDSTVGQLVYERMRSDIIFAVFPPGSRLKLDPLKTTYNASVTTLREVLNRLVSEGFVTAEGQKGFSVSEVSIAGMREVAHLRQLIECDALRHSLEHGNLDWEGAVVAAHYKLASIEEKMINGESVDLKLWKRFDREFHTTLISGRVSEYLLKFHNDVFDHYLRYQMIAMGFRGRIAADEHLQLMKLSLERRADEAAAALAQHIDNGVQHALDGGPLTTAR